MGNIQNKKEKVKRIMKSQHGRLEAQSTRDLVNEEKQTNFVRVQ